MSQPLFEIVTTTAGAVSIRNNAVNEIMHSPVGPWAEANSLYIEQSQLAQRLTEPSDTELVIFDVGLGAAANALAALACIQKTTPRRAVRLVSFERDLELLRFALEHANRFEHFQGYELALESILRDHRWEAPGIEWILHVGDFLETVDKEFHRPHLIFFDPYSPKVNEDMWTTACFRKLRLRCAEPSEGGSLLLTYSQATRIRVAMIQAGFYVGYGSATGLKSETTQAATDRALLKSPLGQPWLERWRKSHLRYPYDCALEAQAQTDALIEKRFLGEASL